MRQPQKKKVAKMASVTALVISLPILYVSLLRLPPAALTRDTTFWFLLSNSIIAIIAAADSAAAPTSSSSSSSPPHCHGHGHDELSLLAAVPAAPAAVDQLPAATAVAVQDDEISRDAPPTSVTPSSDDARTPAVTSLVAPSDDDPPAVNTSDVTTEGERPEQPQQEAATATSPGNDNHVESVKEDDEDEAASEMTMNKSLSLSEEETTQQVVSPSVSSEELAIVTYNDDVVDETAIGAEDEGTIVPWGRPAPTTTTATCSSSKQYWQLSDEELNRKVEEFITRFNREMRLQVLQEAGV